MDVIPAIRTPREEPARDLPRVSERTWTGTYEDYMRSSLWRTNRNAALHRVGWKCERCGSKRGLEVHHRTYVRLGAEWPEDLEAVCHHCHRGHHNNEIEEARRLYLAIVSDCLRRERFTVMSDLLEAVKQSCASKRIPYDADRVWKAVRMVDVHRKGILDAPKPRGPEWRPSDAGRAVTHAEAVGFLRDLQDRGIDFSGLFEWERPISHSAERARAEADEMRRQFADHEPDTPRTVGIGQHARRLPRVRGAS